MRRPITMKTPIRILLATLTLATPLVLAAAPKPGVTIESELARVARMLKGGEAEAALAAARQIAGRDWPDARARDVSLYNLAWTAEKAAAQSADLKLSWKRYEEAVAGYGRFLESRTNHLQAMENLAAVQMKLGRFAAVRELLASLIQAHPQSERLYRWRLALGDAWSSDDSPNVDAARREYEFARKLKPAAREAVDRLVGLFPQLPKSDAEQMYGLCLELESQGQIVAALAGYESLVRRGADFPATGRRAVVRWTLLQGGKEALTPAMAGRLPAADRWDEPMVTGLRRLMTQPDDVTESVLGGWASTPTAKHAIALAAINLAGWWRLQHEDGGPDKPLLTAEKLLHLAERVVPGDHEYRDGRLRGMPMAKLKAGLELAGLYASFPETRFAADFSALEERLLAGKNEAYGESNLPAIQSYHTVLGLIYSDPKRDQWRHPHNWRTAGYHLGRAVTTAQRIAGRRPAEYQPLARLSEIHAQGLEKLQPAKARQLYLDAAQGYLDASDVNACAKALREVRRVESQNRLRPLPKTGGLEQYIQFYKTVGDLTTIPADQAKAWIAALPRETTALNPEFVRRQNLLLLTDLATKAKQIDATEAALTFQKAWYQTAVKNESEKEKLERIIATDDFTITAKEFKAATPKTFQAMPEKLTAEDLRKLNTEFSRELFSSPKQK